VSRLPGEGSCYRDRIPVSIPREAEDTSSRARRNAQKSAKRTKDFAYTDNKGFTDSEAVSLIFAICPQSGHRRGCRVRSRKVSQDRLDRPERLRARADLFFDWRRSACLALADRFSANHGSYSISALTLTCLKSEKIGEDLASPGFWRA
jgi:hypothetical protein